LASEHGTGRIAIFSPNPLLTVTIEARGEGRDDVHIHAGGQGVWAARSAGELGGEPILCGMIGGESGAVLAPLLELLPGARHLVRTQSVSGCYVFDRRSGERVSVAAMHPDPPSRHELDDLFSLTCAAALEAEALIICNPYPPDAWPLEVYGDLAADVGANGTPVLVDLSSPRLDSALEGRPHLVKINDWELAEFISGPVDTPERLRAAAELVGVRARDHVIVAAGGWSPTTSCAGA
jgi:1-phosphofructokinase